jgi:DNA-binding IclR family transcriptional regulator
VIYLESCWGNSPVPLRFDVGSRLPIMLTAIGRAYLAALDEPQFASAMDDIRAAAQADWPQIKSGIERARGDVRRHGFCISIGEWEEGLNAVGVPMVSQRGAILALDCGAPSFLLDPDRLRSDIGPQLAVIAQTASKLPEGDDAATKA